MNWFDRASRDWRRMVENQPTTADGKPNPEALEILNNINVLLKAAPVLRTPSFLRRIRLLIPIIATLVLAYVQFSTFAHNSVGLSVTANEVSFTLDTGGEAPVLRELSLRKLVANPVNVLRTCSDKSGPLTFSTLDHEGGTVVLLPPTRMRLNTFLVPAGTTVTLSFPEGQQGLRMILEYPKASTLEITGSAAGISGGRSCDFVLQSQGNALELTMLPEDSELSEPAYGQIPISTIQFNLPRFELGRSLSSIETGILSFNDVPNTEYALHRGARLSLDLHKGTLADLRVADQKFSLLVSGDAFGVRLGYRDQRSITPTKLDWLRSRAPNIELWMGLLYLAAILFGIDFSQLRPTRGST
jgi:hypothetical protein